MCQRANVTTFIIYLPFRWEESLRYHLPGSSPLPVLVKSNKNGKQEMLNKNALCFVLLCQSSTWAILLRDYLSKQQLMTLEFGNVESQERYHRGLFQVSTEWHAIWISMGILRAYLDRHTVQIHHPAVVVTLNLEFWFGIKMHRKGKWKLSCFRGTGNMR